jgi:hypothetical protein
VPRNDNGKTQKHPKPHRGEILLGFIIHSDGALGMGYFLIFLNADDWKKFSLNNICYIFLHHL